MLYLYHTREVIYEQKNIIKYLLDIFLSLGFVLLYDKNALGMNLHEIMGLVIGGAVIIHLALNFNWVIGVSKKIFSKKITNRVRLSYILNLLLFLCVALIILAGVFISKTIFTNIHSENQIWKIVHIGVSNLALTLIGIHIGLNWTWVINMSKRVFKFNLKEKISKVLSTFLVIAILIFGSYNIYSKGFIQKSFMLFTVSQNSNYGNGNRMQKPEGTPSSNKNDIPKEDISEGKGKKDKISNEDSEKFKNNNEKLQKGKSMKKASIFALIINYASICGVFTIITYYIDKLLKKKKLAAK